MQKEFLKSCEGFLRAALTVHGHPGPVWKIAKMVLFDPWMEFEMIMISCQQVLGENKSAKEVFSFAIDIY